MYVGFEERFYRANESSSDVDACIHIISGTIERNFNLDITTENFTATDGGRFILLNHSLLPFIPHSHTYTLTYSHSHCHTHTFSPSLSHSLSPEDYVHYEETVTVPGASPGNRSCFSVNVLDDDLVEPTENFILSLTTGDAAIRITNSATGVIYDNDGNGVCCFTRCTCEFVMCYIFQWLWYRWCREVTQFKRSLVVLRCVLNWRVETCKECNP